MAWVLALTGWLVAAPAMAQPGAFAVRVQQVAPGVAVLFGNGGNIALSYGEDGNLLVDDQYAASTNDVLAAVESVHPGPVRFVVNTHFHNDHAEGNENLQRLGAIVFAQENVRLRMTADQVVRGKPTPASPPGALPRVTFERDLQLHLNGDDIIVTHVALAHTDGDSLISWRRANVLHMGDIYLNGMLPFIDLDAGGSIDGMIAAVDVGLGLANDRTVVIPGHGPLGTRRDLAAYRAMLGEVRAQIAEAIAKGRTLAEIQAMRLVDRRGRNTDFVSPDAFVEIVYRSLKR